MVGGVAPRSRNRVDLGIDELLEGASLTGSRLLRLGQGVRSLLQARDLRCPAKDLLDLLLKLRVTLVLLVAALLDPVRELGEQGAQGVELVVGRQPLEKLPVAPVDLILMRVGTASDPSPNVSSTRPVSPVACS